MTVTEAPASARRTPSMTRSACRSSSLPNRCAPSHTDCATRSARRASERRSTATFPSSPARQAMPGTVCAYLTTPTSHAYSRRVSTSFARSGPCSRRPDSTRSSRRVVQRSSLASPSNPTSSTSRHRSMTCLNPSLLPCCVRISAAGAFIASRTAASSTCRKVSFPVPRNMPENLASMPSHCC